MTTRNLQHQDAGRAGASRMEDRREALAATGSIDKPRPVARARFRQRKVPAGALRRVLAVGFGF